MNIKMGRNLGKLAVLALAAVMTVGFSLTAYADESETVQESNADMKENDDKVRVILPTDAVGIYDFIMDPQELICKTNPSVYEGKTFEEGATLFFKRSESDALVDYSSTSDAVTITNKGPVPVDVVITAGITVIAQDKFAMTDDKEFTDDTRPSLYLALTDGETEVPIMGEGEDAASLTLTIPPFSAEEEGVSERSFRLTGAANKKGDWSGMEDVSFGVTVTWIAAAQEEPITSDDKEDIIPESSDTGLSDMQDRASVPAGDPGEKIVRKIVPVATDNNVTLDIKR